MCPYKKGNAQILGIEFTSVCTCNRDLNKQDSVCAPITVGKDCPGYKSRSNREREKKLKLIEEL